MGSKPSIDIGVMEHGGRNWSSGLRFESFYISIYCGVEQLVAQWAHNPKVAGSSPAPATKGPSVQLEWTPPCHGGDHGFESRMDRDSTTMHPIRTAHFCGLFLT